MFLTSIVWIDHNDPTIMTMALYSQVFNFHIDNNLCSSFIDIDTDLFRERYLLKMYEYDNDDRNACLNILCSHY